MYTQYVYFNIITESGPLKILKFKLFISSLALLTFYIHTVNNRCYLLEAP